MKQFSLETQSWEDEQEAEAVCALGFLQAVYSDIAQPLSVRIRCAVEALPFESPKLSAVAVGHLTRDDFAARLERAIARSGKAPLMIEAKAIEVGEG